MVEVGAHVVHAGTLWQVTVLEGQRICLVAEDGSTKTLLHNGLFADPGFEVVGAQPVPAVPQWGLFETAPAAARERALAWLGHIREVETGLPHPPSGDGSQTGRAQYDPQRFTLAERDAAKAAELADLGFGRVSATTVERMRLAYRRQGLWGLLDKRTVRAAHPARATDERVLAAVHEALRRQHGRSTGTTAGLRILTGQILDDRHGPGTVPLPSSSSFYRLVNTLTHTGSPPQHPAPASGLPARTGVRAGPRTGAVAVLRPGEQVQVDSTRLDIMAVLEDGSLGRPELTIAVDVATRSLLDAILRPHGTKAVDAALLLAEIAVPHQARPAWPHALHLSHAAVPYQRLLSLDQRLDGAAARPVIVPETIVVDRGKIYLSACFTAACETLGISVQPAPPRRPQTKAVVERTFRSINDLFCQHVAGHTGSNPPRRGANTTAEARWTIPQLQDYLDEWITAGWQNRPHDGLRHPALPKQVLTPNQMWAALLNTTGYVPLPLTGTDYLELLPVRWQAITDRGIRLDHRTYDHPVLDPHRGHRSPVTAKDGKWEIHHNPHDGRHIWIRLPDGQLHEIGWIHRDHIHQPFNEHTWRHIHTQNHQVYGDRDQHEADLAHALDQLLRRTRGHTPTDTPHDHATARSTRRAATTSNHHAHNTAPSSPPSDLHGPAQPSNRQAPPSDPSDPSPDRHDPVQPSKQQAPPSDPSDPSAPSPDRHDPVQPSKQQAPPSDPSDPSAPSPDRHDPVQPSKQQAPPSVPSVPSPDRHGLSALADPSDLSGPAELSGRRVLPPQAGAGAGGVAAEGVEHGHIWERAGEADDNAPSTPGAPAPAPDPGRSTSSDDAGPGERTGRQEREDGGSDPLAGADGYGLWDAEAEAEQW
ncbi:transposase [Streptomyces sp. NPDC060187]|uniref:transposase n=1 Tax=Streptomyces sp. NPDC060187 TaxID=3347067 RepID=UPI0036464CB0